MSHDTLGGETCPVCGRGFGERIELERHAESAHHVLSDFLEG